MAKKKRTKTSRVLLTVICGLCVLLIALISVYMLWEEAPEIESQAPSIKSDKAADSNEKSSSPADEPEEIEADSREGGVYTILLVGNDNGFGNTDTIIVGKIDAGAHTMNFLSIPRDTLVNLDWNVRKINAVYAGTRNSGGEAIDGLKKQIKNIMGYSVDCYAVIDLNVFVETIDLLGGVYFDVPMQMDYEDAKQNLFIHLSPGYQLLNGEQCMELCRFRSGYRNGDIGRVEMQQRFLKAMAEQFISLGNIPNISKILELLTDNLDTDLDASNIAFFLRQALMCKSEDINFFTLPNTPCTVYALSYVLIDINDWLTMLNGYFNPFDAEITAKNLNVVFLTGSGFGCTQTLQGAWYFTAQPEGSQEPETTEEPLPPEETPTEEAPEQTDAPVQSEAPVQTDSPAPEEQPQEPPQTEPETVLG